jgi:bis(5'-nucleosidyl)-tetraphosphatase
MHPAKVVHEKSCGVIIFHKRDNSYEYLLLHYPGGHWDFPKGHVEKFDKSEMDTAARELEEETGITNYEFSKGYQESMYYEFNRGKKERVKKTVVYFLAQAMGNDVKISHEHKNFIWLPFKEAVEKLTFENARDLLRKSEAHLNPHAT